MSGEEVLTRAALEEVLRGMTGEMVMFESHIERMDREKQAQEAALRVEREKTRQARWEAVREVGLAWVIGVLVAGLLGWISWITWQGVEGPSASEEQEQEARLQCIDAGGTWLGSPASDQDGSCVMPGVSTK